MTDTTTELEPQVNGQTDEQDDEEDELVKPGTRIYTPREIAAVKLLREEDLSPFDGSGMAPGHLRNVIRGISKVPSTTYWYPIVALALKDQELREYKIMYLRATGGLTIFRFTSPMPLEHFVHAAATHKIDVLTYSQEGDVKAVEVAPKDKERMYYTILASGAAVLPNSEETPKN